MKKTKMNGESKGDTSTCCTDFFILDSPLQTIPFIVAVFQMPLS
jgi:hypothetical protein